MENSLLIKILLHADQNIFLMDSLDMFVTSETEKNICISLSTECHVRGCIVNPKLYRVCI